MNLKNDPEIDYYLENNDQIIIPIFKPQIFVFGEVINPGAITYSEGKSVDYYLQKQEVIQGLLIIIEL